MACPFMKKASAETRVQRLARYHLNAQECRDRVADAVDRGSRRHFTALAEHYDLMIMLENESARVG